MEILYQKIIETTIVLIILVLVRQIVLKQVIKRFLLAKFSLPRKQLTMKLLNFLFFIALVIVMAGVWGLKGEQILTYVASTLTILGVAFFAQWSLLSNITSGLILFFYHPLKLGDTLSIIDKDFPLEGTVEDITFFFLHIRDNENRVYTIPNSIVIQKTLRIIEVNKGRLEEKESIDEKEINLSDERKTVTDESN
jgi:small-conductance mechanosensitive channel